MAFINYFLNTIKLLYFLSYFASIVIRKKVSALIQQTVQKSNDELSAMVSFNIDHIQLQSVSAVLKVMLSKRKIDQYLFPGNFFEQSILNSVLEFFPSPETFPIMRTLCWRSGQMCGSNAVSYFFQVMVPIFPTILKAKEKLVSSDKMEIYSKRHWVFAHKHSFSFVTETNRTLTEGFDIFRYLFFLKNW